MLLSLFFFSSDHCAQFNPAQHAQEKLIDEGIKTGFQIVGQQVNDELSYYRTKNRVLTPAEQAAELLNQKQQKVADIQAELAQEQKKLTAAQIEDAELDTFSKKYQITRSFYEQAKSKEGDDIHERYRLKIREMNKDLPELPAKDTPETKPEEPAKDDPKKSVPKKSLFSKLATPFVFALTTTGDVADFLAGYSVAHITNLDCFKDTFVQTPTFNRVVVIATIAGATYGGYQFYKSRYSDDDDDNILDLD